MLDLEEPREAPEPPGKGNLRLVPRGPNVVFRRPMDPDTPWSVRMAGALIGLVITALAAGGILLFAALVKEMYERVDAMEEARAEKARQEEAARKGPEGAIPLTLTSEPGSAPLPPAEGPAEPVEGAKGSGPAAGEAGDDPPEPLNRP